MKVSQFMQQALFDEVTGYYKTKNPIGKNADFITAPEISQTFGEMLGLYILQASLGYEGEIDLVEMGAGRGVLFYDILFFINKLAKNKNPQALDFLKRARFHVIEINEVLIKIQQEKLVEFKITWHKNLNEFLQNSKKIFFIANELFDCFPIAQYIKTDIGWCERLIGEAQFITDKFNPKIHNFVENLIGTKESQKAPFGAVFEYSQMAKDSMLELCNALQNKSGIAVIIDYGYKQKEFANTLQAIKDHKKTNVLEHIGQSDITAHVDFSLLEKIAKDCNLSSSLISQAEFLLALGIEERRKILLKNKNLEEQKQINSAINRLIDKDKMGELFKCLIVWKN